MATQYTTLLGFALPVTGELSGTWGDTVNNSITQLVEDSVAGVATQSVASADWTLSTTGSGQTNQARCAILRPTGSSGSPRNIIAPSSSKAYIVDNQSNVAVTVKGAATTGVAVAAGTAALVAWNGSDFVLVAQNLANATGTLPVSKGGTGQTTYTDGQLLIGNSSGNTLTKATLTAGSGVTITNGNGSISIAATGSGGTVTNVQTSGSVNGLTLTGGPITGSGTVTLGGGVNVSTITTGTLPVARGGTGVSTYTNGQLLIGSTPTGGLSAATLTAGTGITVTNAAGAITIAASGGGANIQTFSATGTYTKPPSASFVLVELYGAGGGGAASNSGPPQTRTGGGGGGAYAYRMFAAPEVGATETVTIGAGGSGGATASSNGTNGGSSNFGTLLYAGGGENGQILATGGRGGTVVNISPNGGMFAQTSPTALLSFNLAGQPNTNLWPTTDTGINYVRWSVWGGGAGAQIYSAPDNAENRRGAISYFGGGGGGGGAFSGQPTGGTGGLGRVIGRFPATSNFPDGTSAGTAGANYDGGGGGNINGNPGGAGGRAGGGGGGGWNPGGPIGTGGAGGNGYAVIYSW